MTRLRPQDAEQRRLSGLGPDFSEALARGLQVIMAFTEERRQMTLTEISRVVDLPKATVRRAVYTLQSLSFIEVEGRQFKLTPRILRLAHAYLVSNAVSTILQPQCEAIARAIGESCTAAVLELSEVVMIARAVPSQTIAVGAGIGFRLPAFSSALGRVLLSALPDPDIDRYLAQASLIAETPYTVTDPDLLRSLLHETAKVGYAYADQEAEFGFRSIAVPVRKFDGSVIAALNIGARVERVTPEAMVEHYLPLLREAAEELRQQLV